MVALFRRSSWLDRTALSVIAIYIVLRAALFWHPAIPGQSFFSYFALFSLIYILVRLIRLLRRRLLWSLRNRLIVAYLFIAVVPLLLLITMAALSAYLLELQIGAHLLRDDIAQRVNMITADTNAIAVVIGREASQEASPLPTTPATPAHMPPAIQEVLNRPGVAGVVSAAQNEWPGLIVRVNMGWDMIRHEASRQFSGLCELGGRLFVASAQVIPGTDGRNSVMVLAPVTPALLNSFPSKLGPVQLTLLAPAGAQAIAQQGIAGAKQAARQRFTFNSENYTVGQVVRSDSRAMPPRRMFLDVMVNGYATLDALRVEPQVGSEELPVLVTYAFRLSAVNEDLLTSLGDIASAIRDILIVAVVVFMILEIAALAAGIALTRTITHSVGDLYEATQQVRRGDLSHRVNIKRQDQLGALGQSFNDMIGSVGQLIEEQRRRQRLENEIAIARDVQLQLFPKNLPQIPGVELAGICRPARAVSGDYFDFIPLHNGRVAIVVADISGKGIFASLLMASLQATLRGAASMDGDLDTAHLVSRVNEHLFQTTSEDRYATLFYGVYDPQARKLHYTNAGHVAPLFVTPGTVQTLTEGGTVIGLFEQAAYVKGEVDVPHGAMLVVFSDGLTEPENAFGEQFGAKRLEKELLRERDAPVRKIAEDLIAAAAHWSGSPEQADDMTVVIARMS